MPSPNFCHLCSPGLVNDQADSRSGYLPPDPVYSAMTSIVPMMFALRSGGPSAGIQYPKNGQPADLVNLATVPGRIHGSRSG